MLGRLMLRDARPSLSRPFTSPITVLTQSVDFRSCGSQLFLSSFRFFLFFFAARFDFIFADFLCFVFVLQHILAFVLSLL